MESIQSIELIGIKLTQLIELIDSNQSIRSILIGINPINAID